MTADYAGLFHALLPEFSLVVGALVVIGFDFLAGKNRSDDERLRASVSLAAFAVLAAAWHVVRGGQPGPVFGAVLQLDLLTLTSRLGVLLLTLFTLALAPGGPRRRHPAEFVALLLFAAAGFSLMCAAQQLLLVFLAVELASLTLYLLAGFDKSSPASAEAGLKYFLFGGMAAAFLLFGFSLLYGLTGSIALPDIAVALAHSLPSPLLSVALVMVLVAFGFKAAAAPFHLWAPDVYEGAPAASAALIASASKLAGLTVFLRLLWPGLHAAAGDITAPMLHPGWLTIVVILAAASLALGNLAALAQTSLRRLLAYSAIAHAAIMLLAVIAAGWSGPGPLVYYAVTYGLATVGTFGVIAVLERAGVGPRITDLAGLHRRSPLLAAVLFVCVLSLAGIPPLAGFFAKFSVFTIALQIAGVASPAGWLALAGIAFSAVALYYYLAILKSALVAAPAPAAPRVPVSPDIAFTLSLIAAFLLLLGLFPTIILNLF